MKLLDALRRTTHDDSLPPQPTDDDLLAWAEALRASPQPRRRRPLVAAPAE